MKVAHSNINTFLYTPNKYFEIPDFQRPYSWESDNVYSFLDDLEKAMQTDQNHYFGSIVYIVSGKESTIIDGQQRATTVLLMITAIYHLVKADPSKSSMSEEEMNENFLYNKFGDEQNRIKLRTVTVDNEVFRKIYEESVESTKDKESRLYRTYKLFMDYFSNKSDLDKYINALEKLEIVDICLEASDDNPQKIFESINSTGKPLSDGDKIRNFALMLSGKQARKLVLENHWRRIERELTDSTKDYITDFFRFYIISVLQSDIKLNAVYPEFKKLFDKEIGDDQDLEKLQSFYEDISESLDYYLLCKFVRNDKEKYEPITGTIYKMSYLKIESFIPFAMSVLKHHNAGELEFSEVKRVFSIIENYYARRIICNIAATSVNKIFASLHKDILRLQSKNDDANYADVMAYLLKNRTGGTRYPNDQEVYTAVQSVQTYNQRNTYIHFILSIPDDTSRESSLLKELANKEVELSIEHIMPQTLTENWRKELGPDCEQVHETYLHTLPNLTLTGYNSSYSNKDFESKKTIKNGFNDSPLKINSYVRQQTKWTNEQLDARAQWWKEQILDVYPSISSDFEPIVEILTHDVSEEIDYSYKKITGVYFYDDFIEAKSWAAAIDETLKRLQRDYSEEFEKITEDDWLTKYFSFNDKDLRSPNKLGDSGLYYETNTSSNAKVYFLKNLVEYLGIEHEAVKIALAKAEDDPDSLTPEYHMRSASSFVQEAYEALKAEIELLWPDIEEITWKSFIGYREGGKRMFFFHIQKYKMSMQVSEDIDEKTESIIKKNDNSHYVDIRDESDIAKGIRTLQEVKKVLS